MMNDFKDETLTLDFDCKSCNDKVTKAWANDHHLRRSVLQ